MSDNVSPITADKVREWLEAGKEVRDLGRRLNSAQCRLANAEIALGKWLVPADQPYGTSFNIWYGSGIIEAMCVECGKYTIKWRKKPDGKHAQDIAHLLA